MEEINFDVNTVSLITATIHAESSTCYEGAQQAHSAQQFSGVGQHGVVYKFFYSASLVRLASTLERTHDLWEDVQILTQLTMRITPRVE